MKALRLYWIVGAWSLGACGGDTKPEANDNCTTGDEGCACYANSTCNGTLSCLSDLCVDQGSTSDGGSGGDGDPMPGDGGDNSAGGTGGDGATPGESGGAMMGGAGTGDDGTGGDGSGGDGSGGDGSGGDGAGGVPVTLSCEAINCPPLIGTGQSQCYNDTTEIDCTALPCESDGGPAFCGQDAQYASGARSFSCLDAGGASQVPCDETADEGEVVQDPAAGLEWQRTRTTSTVNFSEALAYCEDTLNAESYGGKTDWRLPTIRELSSLSVSSTWLPTLDPLAFPGTYGAEVWTITPLVEEEDGDPSDDAVWILDFEAGFRGTRLKTNDAHVRCVRGDEWAEPASRMTESGESGSEVVTDRMTGLEWQGGAVSSMDFGDALNHCESLDYAGHTDWRLPDLNQLSSLVDYGHFGPATEMPQTESVAHWSSTTASYSINYGWAVHFEFGGTTTGQKSGTLFKVRCVRQP